MMSKVTEIVFDGTGTARLLSPGAEEPPEVACRFYPDGVSLASGLTLPPMMADLLDIAVAVYVADRVKRRTPPSHRLGKGWDRSFRLHLPVRNPSLWLMPEVYESMISSLSFFTDDSWEFVFDKRNGFSYECERQLHLDLGKETTTERVALFSGGLDSLAGAALDLASEVSGGMILISGVTNPRIGSVIKGRVKALNEFGGGRVSPVSIPLGLSQTAAEYNQNEPSQRSRGFLYGTLGVVMARLAGLYCLHIYENGVGAINLPLSSAQFGAHSTRSTNPLALEKLACFLSLALDADISFSLPNLLLTKREMCVRLADLPIFPELAKSVSCDGFPLRNAKAQCGTCSSCLLRRVSLTGIGLSSEESGAAYLYDVLGELSEIKEARLRPLRAMMRQVVTLQRCLSSAGSWETTVSRYPMLQHVAWLLSEKGITEDDNSGEESILRLFREYCEDWRRFSLRSPWLDMEPCSAVEDWRLGLVG